MRLRRSADSEPPGLDWDARGPWATHNESTSRHTIEYDGATYVCRIRDASDGPFRMAYGSPVGGGDSRVFLFSNGELRWTRRVDAPIAGFVSDSGTAVVLGGGASDELDGNVHAFDADGRVVLEDSYRANVADGDLAADGSLAVVQTHPPDNRTYLYDLRSERLVAEHSSDWARPTVARFVSDDDARYVYLATSHTKRPLYALDETGSMAWESDRHRTMRPLFERIRARFSS